jgi:hypothetical protein
MPTLLAVFMGRPQADQANQRQKNNNHILSFPLYLGKHRDSAHYQNPAFTAHCYFFEE